MEYNYDYYHPYYNGDDYLHIQERFYPQVGHNYQNYSFFKSWGSRRFF